MMIATIPTVVRWVSFSKLGQFDPAPIEGVGGWFNARKNKLHTFGYYLEAHPEESRPYILALREEASRFNLRTFVAFGVHRQMCPVFSDGTAVSLSQRAWGDFVAALWTSQDKPLAYTDFV
jgi:hypothetical protein